MIISGSDYFRFRSFSVPIISGSDHFRFRSFPVTVISGSDHFRLRSFPVTIISGYDHFRLRSLPVPTISDSDNFRFRSLPVQIINGSDHVTSGPRDFQGHVTSSLRNFRSTWLANKQWGWYTISTTNLAACVCVCGCAQFDQFLPVRSHFDTKRPVNFFHIASFPSPTFGPLFSFHFPLFFYEKQ